MLNSFRLFFFVTNTNATKVDNVPLKAKKIEHNRLKAVPCPVFSKGRDPVSWTEKTSFQLTGSSSITVSGSAV